MDRIDGILMRRLLAATGGWRRLSADLHLARRGHKPSRCRLGLIAGAHLHAVMLRNGRATDFVRHHVDYSIPDPGDDDIMIAADVELAPGVFWNGIHLVTPEGSYPETLRIALDGRPASVLIEHPDIPPDATLRRLTEIAPADSFIRIDGVPSTEVPKARAIDILRARISNTLASHREGMRHAKPIPPASPWMLPLLAIMALVNARFLIPALRPHGSVLIGINAAAVATCVASIAINLDSRLRYPLAMFRTRVHDGCIEQNEAIERAHRLRTA